MGRTAARGRYYPPHGFYGRYSSISTAIGSLAKTLGSLTVNAAGTNSSIPSWNVASLTLDFYQGTANSTALAAYIDNWNPSAYELQRTSGTFQSGVSLDTANVEIDYDGVGAIANSTTTISIVATASAVTMFNLTSVAGGTRGFAIGHIFAEGDIPSGDSVTTNTTDVTGLRAHVHNYWPDGSVKFAVLCGRATLTANVQKTITIQRTSASLGGTAVSIADLKATGITASIDYGSYGTVSWTVAGGDWDSPFAWKGGTTESDKAFVYTPEMSSWIYRKQFVGDNHLVGWLEVRCWANGQVEVVPWLENGYLTVPSPDVRTGAAIFTLGGTPRFNQSLTLYHHTRAVLASGTTFSHWLGADPQLSWKHNRLYLQATKLIPTYRAQTPSTGNIWSRLVTSYTPLAQSNYPNSMGAGGYHLSIGLLPQYSVAYLTSDGDIRAWRSVQVNAMCAGRYSIHFRDEATNRPLRFSQRSTMRLNPSQGVAATGTGGTAVPSASGGHLSTYYMTHSPEFAAFAYQITGRYYYMEETQFQATVNFLRMGVTSRQSGDGIFNSTESGTTVRGSGWAMRSLGNAATFTPDADPLRAEFIASIDANIDWNHDRYVINKPAGLGFIDEDSYKPWQDHFNSASWGQMKDQKVFTPSQQTKLNEFLDWRFRFVVGLLQGQGADEYCYRYSTRYGFDSGTSADTARASTTFGELFAAVVQAPNDCNASTVIEDVNDLDTGYLGNLHPAISAAVNHGAAGASLAWDRVTLSGGYESWTFKQNDIPEWSVIPRGWPIP